MTKAVPERPKMKYPTTTVSSTPNLPLELPVPEVAPPEQNLSHIGEISMTENGDECTSV